MVGKPSLRGARRSHHRPRLCRVARHRDRDMALGGEQARCGIEANPTGAWQVDLCPGVKIRAHRLSKSLSLPGARLLLSRLGAGLDQITGDKPSRKPEL